MIGEYPLQHGCRKNAKSAPSLDPTIRVDKALMKAPRRLPTADDRGTHSSRDQPVATRRGYHLLALPNSTGAPFFRVDCQITSIHTEISHCCVECSLGSRLIGYDCEKEWHDYYFSAARNSRCSRTEQPMSTSGHLSLQYSIQIATLNVLPLHWIICR